MGFFYSVFFDFSTSSSAKTPQPIFMQNGSKNSIYCKDVPFGGQKLKCPPEMKIYIGIFVHESYAKKCKARLVGLIDNDDDVFYLILLYYNHFTQKPDGSVRRAVANEFFVA